MHGFCGEKPHFAILVILLTSIYRPLLPPEPLLRPRNRCRFINADALVSTGQGLLGNNTFAYCMNNPVCLSDTSGTLPASIHFDDSRTSCGNPLNGGSGGGGLGFSSFSTIYESVRTYVNNTDPATAIDGKGITFYKGVPVIHLPFEWTAFSFGVIVLGSQYESDSFGITMLNHEYGHALQLKEYGLVSYTSTVAIPSVICHLLDNNDLLPWSYYSSPWEYEADQLGGVARSTYATWARQASGGYSYFSKIVGMISVY